MMVRTVKMVPMARTAMMAASFMREQALRRQIWARLVIFIWIKPMATYMALKLIKAGAHPPSEKELMEGMVPTEKMARMEPMVKTAKMERTAKTAAGYTLGMEPQISSWGIKATFIWTKAIMNCMALKPAVAGEALSTSKVPMEMPM